MAKILVLQCSGRRKGYTASIKDTVAEHLSGRTGIETEVIELHDYTYGPCTSCFSCIAKVGGGCVLKDDWGRNGEGPLYKAFKRANAMISIDPVHSWGLSAAAKTFFERIYPTFWEGTPYGLPFASISCASNQGFQFKAMEEYCKLAAGYGFRYIGGLAVHALYIKSAYDDARSLADKLADAALHDESQGRKKLTDEEIFSMYCDTPWSIVDGYLQNLTNNTFCYEDAVPVRALADGLVTNPEARPLMEKVCEHLRAALEHYHNGDRTTAAGELALTAKFWTNATYKQCCENITVKTNIPKTYRPLDEIDS